MKQKLYLTLVAGRRPSLLGQMLQSFAPQLKKQFDIDRVEVNIDPFMGDPKQGQMCRKLILEHFPQANVSEPGIASHGMAVKSLWCRVGLDYPVLHLEDDWVLENKIPDAAINDFEKEHDLGFLSFSHNKISHKKNRDTSDYVTRRAGLSVFGKGFIVPLSRVNAFGVSPCFIRPGLAPTFGELMNPDLDPEKQVFFGLNRLLMKKQRPWRSKRIWSASREPLILDIGRDYLSDLGIQKTISNGRAHWSSK